MPAPNFCPSCGADLKKYQENDSQQSSEENSDDKPTREDYRRILNEELEKAEKPDVTKETGSGNSESNLTREDYEEVLERKLEEARQEESTSSVDPEVKEAVENIIEADEESVDDLREGYPKKMVEDIRDIADGNKENLRLLGEK
jgi:rRNA maturation endonuclease Nob1